MVMGKYVDISTLTWIKGEIDESLKLARVALEAFVEESDETQLPLIVASLHQVHGALHMVQFNGAAHFVAEVEALAQAMQDSAETRNDEVIEILMRALLQLPNYLLGLEDGLPDTVIFLLPLINEMREVRDQNPITESELFEPDLSVVPEPIDDQGEFLPSLVRKMRTHFQAALVNVLRNKNIDKSLRKMVRITELLVKGCEQKVSQQFLWIARGFIEALQDDGLELTKETKPLLGKLEQTLKVLATEGESGISQENINSLLKPLLFHVAQSSSSGAYVTELRKAFDLDQLLPSTELIQQAQGNLAGFNDDLKKTVSADIMAELSRVKDALDIFVRGGGQNIADLQPMGEGMAHIADTLHLLNEDSLGQNLREQVDVIQGLVDAGEDDADEQTLMGIASAVLAVDYALRDWGVVSSITQADNPDEQVGDSERTAQAKAEHQRVVRQVMGEAKSDLVKLREAIVSFVENPADKEPLINIPQWLDQITGSLTLLSYNRMAQVLRAIGCFIDEKCMQGDELPSAQILDSLANAIMSVEYYLESFVESKVHPVSMIAVAETAVAELGYSIDALAGKMTDSADASSLTEERDITYESVELDAGSLPEPEPAVNEVDQLPPQVVAANTEIDAEILEIFDEEAQEAFHTISELLPRWKDNSSDEEALTELRRAFHTLKGSGRLVGAM
ncbi:MAG: Hpt domain-containing protein, partial [Gammaproteobacteria bacterium]|nr:Hpt domain-containing protein [Gammaproteobacteria bacterium]